MFFALRSEETAQDASLVGVNRPLLAATYALRRRHCNRLFIIDRYLIRLFAIARFLTMKMPAIKKTSSLFDAARAQIKERGAVGMSDGLFNALADRTREAVETSDHEAAVQFTSELESFYRDLFGTAPERARAASRGEPDDEASLAAFHLGQAAFAHLLVARTVDRRADSRFLAAIRDGRYERYVRALQREPMKNAELAEEIGEREETASRKLGLLKSLGIVSARKEGNSVVNSLTPAALAVLEHYKIAPLAVRSAHAPEVQKVLDEKNDQISSRFRKRSQWGEPVGRRVTKAAAAT